MIKKRVSQEESLSQERSKFYLIAGIAVLAVVVVSLIYLTTSGTLAGQAYKITRPTAKIEKISTTIQKPTVMFASDQVSTATRIHAIWFKMYLAENKIDASKLNEVQLKSWNTKFYQFLAKNQLLYNDMSSKGVIALRDIANNPTISAQKYPLFEKLKTLNADYTQLGWDKWSDAQITQAYGAIQASSTFDSQFTTIKTLSKDVTLNACHANPKSPPGLGGDAKAGETPVPEKVGVKTNLANYFPSCQSSGGYAGAASSGQKMGKPSNTQAQCSGVKDTLGGFAEIDSEIAAGVLTAAQVTGTPKPSGGPVGPAGPGGPVPLSPSGESAGTALCKSLQSKKGLAAEGGGEKPIIDVELPKDTKTTEQIYKEVKEKSGTSEKSSGGSATGGLITGASSHVIVDVDLPKDTKTTEQIYKEVKEKSTQGGTTTGDMPPDSVSTGCAAKVVEVAEAMACGSDDPNVKIQAAVISLKKGGGVTDDWEANSGVNLCQKVSSLPAKVAPLGMSFCDEFVPSGTETGCTPDQQPDPITQTCKKEKATIGSKEAAIIGKTGEGLGKGPEGY
ncbi:hypothetical protein HYX14_00020 [Candidatus Woesearchaeota archaeon]|nr:hypothetical protein [Candidatus Woesearchaeota archaeon]